MPFTAPQTPAPQPVTGLNAGTLQAMTIARPQSLPVAQLQPVVQFGKGRLKRLAAKKQKAAIESDKALDPNEKGSLASGLSADYTGDKLDVSETQTGHGRARHAAKTTAELDARNIPMASTFDSEEDQNEALEQLLTEHRDKVKKWIAEQYGDARLVISGPVEGIAASARRRQSRTVTAANGYQYVNPHIARFVDVDAEEITHATAVLERYLVKAKKKGQTAKWHWRVVTVYPVPE